MTSDLERLTTTFSLALDKPGERLFQFAIEATPIPEPSCLALVVCGVLLLAVLRRKHE